MYAVTFGRRRSFVSRVMRKPPDSISATETITVVGVVMAPLLS